MLPKEITKISITGQALWAGEAAGTSADTGRGWIVVYSTAEYSGVQWDYSLPPWQHTTLQTVLSAVTSTTSHHTTPHHTTPPTSTVSLLKHC